MRITGIMTALHHTQFAVYVFFAFGGILHPRSRRARVLAHLVRGVLPPEDVEHAAVFAHCLGNIRPHLGNIRH
jgi:hypothetical protein